MKKILFILIMLAALLVHGVALAAASLVDNADLLSPRQEREVLQTQGCASSSACTSITPALSMILLICSLVNVIILFPTGVLSNNRSAINTVAIVRKPYVVTVSLSIF